MLKAGTSSQEHRADPIKAPWSPLLVNVQNQLMKSYI